ASAARRGRTRAKTAITINTLGNRRKLSMRTSKRKCFFAKPAYTAKTSGVGDQHPVRDIPPFRTQSRSLSLNERATQQQLFTKDSIRFGEAQARRCSCRGSGDTTRSAFRAGADFGGSSTNESDSITGFPLLARAVGSMAHHDSRLDPALAKFSA